MTRFMILAAALVCVLPATDAPAALLTTSQSGRLIVEAISGEGGSSTQEFGIGTSLADLTPIFTITLNGGITGVSPSDVVDAGYFPAGSELDFYNISSWDGPQYAFSAHLGGSPTASDIVVFQDTNNSLGFGGTVVEQLGLDDWVLHLDDAGSWNVDDDDNEMVIRIRVEPVVEVPGPSTAISVLLGLALLRPHLRGAFTWARPRRRLRTGR